MQRNLYNRVELVVPVEDERLEAELLDVLDRSLADTTNSWDLHPDGGWERRDPGPEPRSVQRELIERYAARASDSAL
jgi:polyphosphate kinase